MIEGKTALAVITARGGSKGVPDKNIRPVDGRPLIAWSVEQAKSSKLLDRVILSSDSPKIAAAARAAGCDVPFMRPAELATDEVGTIDVIRHAMTQVPRHDYLVLLQPTSPLRLAEDIDAAIRLCHERGVSTCVSVSEAGKSPYWMYELQTDGSLRRILPKLTASRRQDLPVFHALNGAVYVARWEHLASGGDFVTDDTIGYEMPNSRSIDIDTELDFGVLDLLIPHRKTV
jgi:CMP-N,N'-diacetyllegionaminic acid synthase